MIKTLDREFFKSWFWPSASSLLVFIILFFIGDLLGSTDKLIEHWPGFSVLTEYYFFRLTYLSYFFLPMSVLLGGFWGLCNWRDTNEWTVALTGGRHPFRLLILPILSLIILTLIMILYSFWLLPTVASRAISLRDVQIKGRQEKTPLFENIHLRLTESRSIKIGLFQPEDKLLKNIVITDKDAARIVKRYDAPRADYIKNEGWLMRDITTRIFKRGGEHTTTQNDTKLIALQPPQFLKSILETNPRYSDKKPEQYKSSELLKAIRFRQQRNMDAGAELVFLHWKLSFPLSIVVLGIAGLLLGVKSNLTKAAGVGFCLLLSFSYWIIYNSFIALGTSAYFMFLPENIGAALAAYLPVILFSGLNLYLSPGFSE
ncbi:MAG: LptF/LptG family permease [bacterium]